MKNYFHYSINNEITFENEKNNLNFYSLLCHVKTCVIFKLSEVCENLPLCLKLLFLHLTLTLWRLFLFCGPTLSVNQPLYEHKTNLSTHKFVTTYN